MKTTGIDGGHRLPIIFVIASFRLLKKVTLNLKKNITQPH